MRTPPPAPPSAPTQSPPAVEGALRTEVTATLRLAVPVAVTQLSMMAMGVIDTLLVGPLGADALGAVGIANVVYFAVTTFFVGVLMALDALISQAFGADDSARAGRLLWQGTWLGLATGVLATLCFLDTRWLFDLAGQPAEVGRLADLYLTARAPSAVALITFTATRAWLNGAGEARPVMVLTLIALVINGVADVGLIYGRFGLPEMGVAGAGLATTIVRWFLLLTTMAVLASPRWRGHNLAPSRPRWRELRAIVGLGLPIGAQMLAEFGIFGAAGVMAGWLGADALAAHQISLTLAALVFMVPVGIAIAGSVRVGQEVGGGRLDGAMRAGQVALALGAAFMVAAAAVFVSVPSWLAGLFSPDPAVVRIGAGLLVIAAIFQVADGLQVVAAGCLRGASETHSALIANLAAHWLVGIPLAWFLAFPMGLGVEGLWWGMTAALFVAGISLTWRFLRGGWRAKAGGHGDPHVSRAV